MASPYTKGQKNSELVGDEFTNGNVVLGNLSVAATSVAATVTLSFTPTFILHSANDDTDGNFTVTTSGTTTGLVTFTRATSTTASTIAYFAGILA